MCFHVTRLELKQKSLQRIFIQQLKMLTEVTLWKCVTSFVQSNKGIYHTPLQRVQVCEGADAHFAKLPKI